MRTVLALAGLVITELYRRKDFYVLFVLVALLTLTTARAGFVQEAGARQIVGDLSLQLIWISSLVIAVAATARQLPAERERRTLFPLLAKPVGRGQFLAGKFLGCWLACGLALVVFYAFFVLISLFQGAAVTWLLLPQAFWMHWGMLAIVVAMTLLGSLVFSAPSANATICFAAILAILVSGAHLHRIGAALPFPAGHLVTALYFLLPHLEWFYSLRERLVFHQDPISLADCLLGLTYAAAYAAALLTAAWMIFRRQTLTSR